MKKIFLMILTLCCASLSYAQHEVPEPPVIILGQHDLTIKATNHVDVSLGNFLLYVADSTRPEDVKIHISEGTNYTIEDGVIYPGSNFVGKMGIPITMSYGEFTTPVFMYWIEVNKEEIFTAGRIFVAPNGDDAIATGAMDKPFKTISAAMEQMKIMRQDAAERCSGNYEICLRGGEYDIDETIEINHDDTGLKYSKLIFAAYSDEKVTIAGDDVIFNINAADYINFKSLNIDGDIDVFYGSSFNKIIDCEVGSISINGYSNDVVSTKCNEIILNGGDRVSQNYGRNRVEKCSVAGDIVVNGVGQIVFDSEGVIFNNGIYNSINYGK